MKLSTKLTEAAVLIVIWGVVAGLALLYVETIANKVAGYGLAALTVVGAWLLTEAVLDALHVNTGYAPD